MSTEIAPYGFCPVPGCGSPGVTRERGWNGNDTCGRGHYYPSRTAVVNAAFVCEVSSGFDIDKLMASFEVAFSKRCPNRSLLKLRSGQYHDPHIHTAWLLYCDGAEAALTMSGNK